jgi:hypothetical protein
MTYFSSPAGSGTNSRSTSAAVRTGRPIFGPSPASKARSRFMACGMVRMSENRMAASSGKRAERLQRDLAGVLGVHAQAEEAARPRAGGTVLRQVAARLAHQPHRRALGRLAQQGAQQQVIGQRRVHGLCLHRVRDPAGGPLAARVAARRLTLRSTTPSPPRTRCRHGRAAARVSATLRQCMAQRPTREPSLGTVMPGLRARWSWPPGVSDFSAGANGRGPDRIPPAGQALISRSAPDPARRPGTGPDAGAIRSPGGAQTAGSRRARPA